ncbi:MAG: FAD:protein FMN transferase [Oscillospiraceae bacterium]|jgi:thiamine biosynthesis lipoprotein|nr:FAD:protein FMN transferase [Oscillospiraceae bacterium]
MKFKILSLLLALTLNGCGIFNESSESPPTLNRTDYALGTYITVKTPDIPVTAASALDKAFARLFGIEMIASAKNPESELFYVNENAYGRDIIVSDELYSLLHTGRFYAQLTDGAFDIALGSIVELWGIGTENARVPEAYEITEALGNSGFEQLVLSEGERTVRFLREGLRIDLGAIAKGYAANEMKRVLVESGVTDAILDLGGDIVVIGSDRRIGIADPRNSAEICAIVTISDKAVMTSGDYERFFDENGVHYHHIFDGTTGFSADSGIISATVIFECAMISDVLSTAFFVMGVERAVEFAATMPEIGYILIDNEMNFYYSENIEIEIIN